MTYLCHTDDLEKTGAKGLEIKLKRKKTDIFVVANEAGVFAYVNRCPHAGTPLEWQEDQFFNPSGDALMCATHGAEFTIEEGDCFAGPCKGDQLDKLEITQKNDKIYLTSS